MFSEIDITTVLMQYVCLLFSLCVHEAAHAAMANRCGDPTARLMGRLSLNPLVHIDPIGTVVLPLLMMTTNLVMFGWAKPVPVNHRNLNDMRRDPVLVALAGPGANLVMLVVGTLVLKLLVVTIKGQEWVHLLDSPVLTVLLYLVMINLVLLVFNLIPVPPLDGSWILHYFLPPSGQQMMERVGPFGILIVLLVGLPLIRIPLGFLQRALMNFVFA